MLKCHLPGISELSTFYPAPLSSNVCLLQWQLATHSSTGATSCNLHHPLILDVESQWSEKTLCTTIQYNYFKSFSLNYEVNIPVCERSAKTDSHFEQRERHGSYPTRIPLPLQPGALQASGLPKTNRNMERAQCSKHLAVFPANLRRHDMTLITKNPCEITIQFLPRSSSSTPAITSKKGNQARQVLVILQHLRNSKRQVTMHSTTRFLSNLLRFPARSLASFFQTRCQYCYDVISKSLGQNGT